MTESLQYIKENLHDANSEVKTAFNILVSYFDKKNFTYKDLYDALKFLLNDYHIKGVYGLDKNLYILMSQSRSSYRFPYQVNDILRENGLPSENVIIAGFMRIPENAIKLK